MRPNFVLILAAQFAFIVAFLVVDKPTRFRPAPPSPQTMKAPAAPSTQAAAPQPTRPPPGEHSDTVESLPEGPGREETFYTCAACHGTMIIKQQGLSRELWDASIDIMIERHGMAKPDDPERAKILDYLTAQFPPRSRSRGRDNPFLQKE